MKAGSRGQLNLVGMVKRPQVTQFQDFIVERTLDFGSYGNSNLIAVFIDPVQLFFEDFATTR